MAHPLTCCASRIAITALAVAAGVLSAADAVAAGGPRYGAGYHARQSIGLRPLSSRVDAQAQAQAQTQAQATRATPAASQADCTSSLAASSPGVGAADQGNARNTPSNRSGRDECAPAKP
jgi:hypothetical protein